MNDEKIFDILMSLQKDVSSIKTDIGNIKDKDREIEDHSERLGQLEKKTAKHDLYFKIFWVVSTAILVFLFADLLAPLCVNAFSK